MAQGALELLQTRRTVSAAYLGDPGPSEAQVRDLVTIAMRVPDHGKLAPWRFVALSREDRTVLAPRLHAIRERQVDEADLPKLTRQLEVFQAAPLCLAVVSVPREHPVIPLWEQELSVGASTMNLMIAAHAMGYGAQWLTGWASTSDEAKALLGVQPQERISAFVHIGTPEAPPVERPRPTLDDHLTIGLATAP